MKWEYLVVDVENKGRKISENGVVTNSHTKKSDMNALPRNMWNAKGKKMIEAAKGAILNEYGNDGWELVSAEITGEIGTNNFKFFFKREIE